MHDLTSESPTSYKARFKFFQLQKTVWTHHRETTVDFTVQLTFNQYEKTHRCPWQGAQSGPPPKRRGDRQIEQSRQRISRQTSLKYIIEHKASGGWFNKKRQRNRSGGTPQRPSLPRGDGVLPRRRSKVYLSRNRHTEELGIVFFSS